MGRPRRSTERGRAEDRGMPVARLEPMKAHCVSYGIPIPQGLVAHPDRGDVDSAMWFIRRAPMRAD